MNMNELPVNKHCNIRTWSIEHGTCPLWADIFVADYSPFCPNSFTRQVGNNLLIKSNPFRFETRTLSFTQLLRQVENFQILIQYSDITFTYRINKVTLLLYYILLLIE